MEEGTYLLLGAAVGGLLVGIFCNFYYAARTASLKASVEALKERLADKQQELQQAKEQLRTDFKHIATEIFEEKSKKLAEQNHFSLRNLLDPLHERMGDFKRKVEEVYDKEAKERFSLEKEIKNLHQLNQQLSKDAHNLVNALKGQNKMQGNWGEMILESILEKSGLEKNREYFPQKSHYTEANQRLQPDVVVQLPNQKYVIIDAKVSLTAYERYSSSDTETDQQLYLRQHIGSLRQHISELGQKNYQQLYGSQSPDFVLLFVPIEPAFSLALQHDSDLFSLAFSKGVVLVSATTLLAALRTIASIWRQEKQNKHAEEIAKEGGLLYEKVVSLLNDLKDLGLKLQYAQNSYEDVMNKLSIGKGNLLSKVEKMKALGIKTNKSLSPHLFEEEEE